MSVVFVMVMVLQMVHVIAMEIHMIVMVFVVAMLL